METPDFQLAVGTRLYVKKECGIMPNEDKSNIKKSEILTRLGGIHLHVGYHARILEIKDHAARIRFYENPTQGFGDPTWWYHLDKFSSELFGIDHRDPNGNEQSLSTERAAELLKGEGTIRSTDKPETVLEVARAAHKRLTGSDERPNYPSS